LVCAGAALNIREQIAEKAAHCERDDYYALLNLGRDTTTQDVKIAYKRLSALLAEPALSAPENADLRFMTDKIRLTLDRAFATLSDPLRRANYEHKQRRGGPHAPEPQKLPGGAEVIRLMRFTPEEKERADTADKFNVAGCRHFARKEYAEAETLLKRAVELVPDHPLYNLKLGWTIFNNPSRERTERLTLARKYLELAAAHAPYDPQARYCMAEYWRESGNDNQCRRELEATLRCDAKHPRASAELERLKARLGQAVRSPVPTKAPARSGVGGLIDRLLGRS